MGNAALIRRSNDLFVFEVPSSGCILDAPTLTTLNPFCISGLHDKIVDVISLPEGQSPPLSGESSSFRFFCVYSIFKVTPN